MPPPPPHRELGNGGAGAVADGESYLRPEEKIRLCRLRVKLDRVARLGLENPTGSPDELNNVLIEP
jgi:hypothetical protein